MPTTDSFRQVRRPTPEAQQLAASRRVARKALLDRPRRRAVDTARVLAADAVEKVGNGHPGTAMSLAPAAYLLFQNVMRHDPADPHWLGRDRFVLSCGHSSAHPVHPALPRRLRPRARRPQGAAHLGLADPGPPRGAPHHGVEITTGPLGSGLASAVGMAMAQRRERGLFDPDAKPGHEPLRPPHLGHRLRRRPHGGRHLRGLLARRPPGARQPHRHLRREPDLDRGRHQHRLHRGRRQALRGLRLARRRRSTGRRRPAGTSRTSTQLLAALEAAAGSHASPRSSSCTRSSRWPAPTKQNTGKSTAPRSAPTSSPPPRRCSASTPRRPSWSPRACSPTPARSRRAARPPTRRGTRGMPRGARPTPSARPCSTASSPATLPDGLDKAAAGLRGRPRASPPAPRPARSSAPSPTSLPELWGGSADLAESNITTIEGAAVVHPQVQADPRVDGRPLRPHAALRHPRARAWARSSTASCCTA